MKFHRKMTELRWWRETVVNIGIENIVRCWQWQEKIIRTLHNKRIKKFSVFSLSRSLSRWVYFVVILSLLLSFVIYFFAGEKSGIFSAWISHVHSALYIVLLSQCKSETLSHLAEHWQKWITNMEESRRGVGIRSFFSAAIYTRCMQVKWWIKSSPALS